MLARSAGIWRVRRRHSCARAYSFRRGPLRRAPRHTPTICRYKYFSSLHDYAAEAGYDDAHFIFGRRFTLHTPGAALRRRRGVAIADSALQREGAGRLAAVDILMGFPRARSAPIWCCHAMLHARQLLYAAPRRAPHLMSIHYFHFSPPPAEKNADDDRHG